MLETGEPSQDPDLCKSGVKGKSPLKVLKSAVGPKYCLCKHKFLLSNQRLESCLIFLINLYWWSSHEFPEINSRNGKEISVNLPQPDFISWFSGFLECSVWTTKAVPGMLWVLFCLLGFHFYDPWLFISVLNTFTQALFEDQKCKCNLPYIRSVL